MLTGDPQLALTLARIDSIGPTRRGELVRLAFGNDVGEVGTEPSSNGVEHLIVVG